MFRKWFHSRQSHAYLLGGSNACWNEWVLHTNNQQKQEDSLVIQVNYYFSLSWTALALSTHEHLLPVGGYTVQEIQCTQRSIVRTVKPHYFTCQHLKMTERIQCSGCSNKTECILCFTLWNICHLKWRATVQILKIWYPRPKNIQMSTYVYRINFYTILAPCLPLNKSYHCLPANNNLGRIRMINFHWNKEIMKKIPKETCCWKEREIETYAESTFSGVVLASQMCVVVFYMDRPRGSWPEDSLYASTQLQPKEDQLD